MSAADPAALGFDARIGGVLVAPRRTLGRLAAGEARASDVVWLLVARLVAGELPRLVRALVMARDYGGRVGLNALLAVVRDLMPDVLGILIGGFVLQLFVPRGARGYGRSFDLAAYAWIPYLAVELVGALGYTVRGYAPSATANGVITGVALAWALAVWTLALLQARRLP